MKIYLNRKFLPYLMCVAAVLFFTADLTLSQTRRSPIKKADWQISTAPNGQGATLGIRDKYGVSGSFKTLFVVAAPNKKTFRKRASGTGDNWVYVNFPADFGVNQSAGIYKVTFYGNGAVIGRSNFKIGK